VHGWDGRGYQRFFSANRGVFESWPRGFSVDDLAAGARRWLTSPVALTLAGMSVIVVVLLWIMSAWLKEGYQIAGQRNTIDAGAIVAAVLGFVFVAALGSAIAASVLIHLLGWWIGVPVAAAVIWLVTVRPRTGIAYLFFERLRISDAEATERVAA
jgi:hypothetical protein